MSAVTAIGYIRVSTDEQASSGTGLTAQRAAIEVETVRRGWTLLATVEDAGFSGRTLRRPGIASVLTALASGQATALVVAKLDRLSRSMLDFAALMERSSKEGWSIVALDLGVDTTTPAGEAMANVMATFAQFERRLIAERTREALAAKRARGVTLGRPVVLSDAIADRIATERAAGRSLRQIASALESEGVPRVHGGDRWHPSTIRAVLQRVGRSA